MMVAVAIIAILAMMTLNGVQGLRPRAKAGTTAADLTAALQAARQEALGDGHYVFVRWLNDPSYSFQGYVVCSSTDSRYRPPPDWTSTDPCGPCSFGGCPTPKYESKSALPLGVIAAAGTDFGSVANVPSVFRNAVSIPSVSSTGCSFCQQDSNQVGWIAFMPDGQVMFPGDSLSSHATGGAILVRADPSISKAAAVYATVVTAPFGLVRSFSR